MCNTLVFQLQDMFQIQGTAQAFFSNQPLIDLKNLESEKPLKIV